MSKRISAQTIQFRECWPEAKHSMQAGFPAPHIRLNDGAVQRFLQQFVVRLLVLYIYNKNSGMAWEVGILDLLRT